ncbi:hypothetical protein B0H10DRAFT_2243559 [Mycena sp. CBHHK59/15]|nr:hypothetical protein B0H10DRAFT_2243559 [Mycena sp. CBHHK59/15]
MPSGVSIPIPRGPITINAASLRSHLSRSLPWASGAFALCSSLHSGTICIGGSSPQLMPHSPHRTSRPVDENTLRTHVAQPALHPSPYTWRTPAHIVHDPCTPRTLCTRAVSSGAAPEHATLRCGSGVIVGIRTRRPRNWPCTTHTTYEWNIAYTRRMHTAHRTIVAHAKMPYLRCCSAISPPSLPFLPSPTTNLRPRATFALSIRGAANPSLQLPRGRRAVHIPVLVVRSLLRTSYLCDIAACPIPRSVRMLALDCSTVLPLYRTRHLPAHFFNAAPAGMARTQHATDLTYFP